MALIFHDIFYYQPFHLATANNSIKNSNSNLGIHWLLSVSLLVVLAHTHRTSAYAQRLFKQTETYECQLLCDENSLNYNLPLPLPLPLRSFIASSTIRTRHNNVENMNYLLIICCNLSLALIQHLFSVTVCAASCINIWRRKMKLVSIKYSTKYQVSTIHCVENVVSCKQLSPK